MNIIPIAKCEYAVWKAPGSVDPMKIGQPQVEYRYDVTLVWEDTSAVVKICLLDKRLGTWQWITVTSAAFQPSGCIMQYGSYLIVSLLDVGTYITWPSAFTIGTPNLLPQAVGYVAPSIPSFVTPELLGLDVCPTPETYDFPLTLTGPLLVLAGQRVNGEDDIVLQYQTITPAPGAVTSSDKYANNVITSIPLDTTYWRAGWLPPVAGTGPMALDATLDPIAEQIVSTGLIDRWKFANKDVADQSLAGLPAFPSFLTWQSSRQHLMHRGYFYRFCFIRQFTNADGNVVQQRSNPSVDLFVPAVNYAPFFWSVMGIAKTGDPSSFQNSGLQGVPLGQPSFPQTIQAMNPAFPNGSAVSDNWSGQVVWSLGNGRSPGVGFGGTPNTGDAEWDPLVVPIPSLKAMTDLQALFRAYFGATGPNDPVGSGQNGDAMQWASQWLGWATQANSTNNTDYQHLPPWICDASAEQITSAPQTIFNWIDFGFTKNGDGTWGFPGGDGNVTLIEVYRTAYEDQDPIARPVSTPLFQPHTYGLVGQILPGQSFTDTTKIPDFGQDPIDFEGYVRGQFSGDVLYQYGQSPAVVLGNIRDDYSLLAPSPLMQAFFDTAPTGLIKLADVSGAPGSMTLGARTYYFAYQDTTGYLSGFTPIAVDVDNIPGGSFGGVAFTFPYGYDPNIANIILWVGIGTGTGVLYAQLAVVNPEPGTYFDVGTVAVGTAAALPTGGDYKFYEPGAIIYSDPDQPWDWPQSQAEKHSSEFPVRGLFDQMGELGVATDSSYTLTLLRAAAPRSERETQEVGLITKNAIAKVQDSVVILSQAGLYFLVPSRAEDLPSHVKVELLAYLKDTIPNLMPLAALRRASIGYLKGREEIWLHIPSDVDLWPLLPDLLGNLTVPNPSAQPQRTFVFGFGKSIRDMDCYTFDICEDFEIKNISQTLPPGFAGAIAGPDVVDPATYNHTQVLFCSGSDGGMFASWCDKLTGNLFTIDCDVPNVDFLCAWYGTLSLGLEEPSGQKQIERTEVLMAARGQVQIITGIAKKVQYAPTVPSLHGGTSVLRGWDAIRGFIHNAARIFNFRKIYTDQPRRYTHPGSELGVETTGSTVMVRLRGTPDAQGRNKATLNGITVYYDQKHQHG